MSQQNFPDNVAPKNETTEQEASNPRVPRSRSRWKCGLLAGLILGSLAGIILLLVCLSQYEATATIQVRSAQPLFIADSRRLTEGEYNNFVRTQIALLKSPNVIDRALEDPEVARLPIVIRREWLTRKLRVKHICNSEIVSVSIKTNSVDASERIVNAVVEAYFTFIEEVARSANASLISSLRVEERRQRQLAQTLREGIRSKTRQAVISGFAPATIDLARSESLVQEILSVEIKLTTMRAQRRAIIERMEQPGMMPISMLLQMHPELKRLDGQREVLWQQKEEQLLVYGEDDPRIVEIDQQIERIDERVRNLASGADSRGLEVTQVIQNEIRLQEEMNLFQTEQEVRVLEILLEELSNRHNEHLLRELERAENVLDVSFELAQLERTNRTLDQIEERILAVTTAHRAPAQITPLSRAVSSMPNWTKAVIVAGIGFIVFFCLPLIVCAVCLCCRKVV